MGETVYIIEVQVVDVMGLRLSFTKISLSFLLITAVWLLYHLVVASGEHSEPKAVLLRLEDVGPGGEYSTPDQLGKLRAVLEYLQDQGVSYQIGVVPKWVNYNEAGDLTYSQSLDDNGSPYIRSFVKMLKDAERNGAVVGMHGYTHQVGQVKRPDGHQETGIGNEFNEADLPETASLPYADVRMKEGLRIFEAAGIKPAFWETPHYHSAPEQHQVFRSYFGLIHESPPAIPPQNGLYIQAGKNSGFGASTWGAAYVPTPFSYIPYNKDEKLILDQLGKSDRLPAFFYHAFLEFKYLSPVLDENGNPAVRDGLPEYKYPDKNKTILQKLIVSFREREYQFYSIHDYVPFIPSNTLAAGGQGKPVRLGDSTGDGQLDTVVWQTGNGSVLVTPGQFRGYRNDPQPKAETWAVIPRKKGDLYALKDENGDGLADLWIVRSGGKLELYRSTGASFAFTRSWTLPSAPAFEEIYLLKQRDGSVLLAGASDNGTKLTPYWKVNDVWKQGEYASGRSAVYKSLQIVKDAETGGEQLARCRKDIGVCYRMELPPGTSKWTIDRQEPGLPHTGDAIQLGDFNGDGREDVLLWDESGHMATVYRQTEEGEYVKLSSFGPWGQPGAKLIVADFDGNGKLDLAAAEQDGSLDLALSYQTLDGVAP